MAEVLVLAERTDGAVRKASLELLTLARRLGEPAALVCGPADDATARVLGTYGATKVYAVEGAELDDYLVLPKVDALVAVVRQSAPAAVLVTSGPEGKEIAARAAVRLDSGIITDAVDVDACRRWPASDPVGVLRGVVGAEPGRPGHTDHRRPAQRGRRAAGAGAARRRAGHGGVQRCCAGRPHHQTNRQDEQWPAGPR